MMFLDPHINVSAELKQRIAQRQAYVMNLRHDVELPAEEQPVLPLPAPCRKRRVAFQHFTC